MIRKLVLEGNNSAAKKKRSQFFIRNKIKLQDFTCAIRHKQTATICEHHELELLHVQ